MDSELVKRLALLTIGAAFVLVGLMLIVMTLQSGTSADVVNARPTPRSVLGVGLMAAGFIALLQLNKLDV